MSGLGTAKPKRKSEFTLRMEEALDAAVVTHRCDCGFSVTGPTGQMRERMRDHRREEHPDRPLIAKRPKKAPKRQVEQTSEDKAILAAIAQRERPKPRPTRRRLSAANQPRRTARAPGPGKGHGRGGNFTSGAERRGGTAPLATKLIRPEREEAAWKLYMAGLSLAQISHIAYEKWGFKNEQSCRVHLGKAFRLSGRPVRDGVDAVRLFYIEIPLLNRRQAIATLEEAG